MRAPNRRRPRRRQIHIPPDVDLNHLTSLVVYRGSSEHKDIPSFAGPPRLRADASCCPREITEQLASQWLRIAIRRGVVGAPWEGGFPRYLWYRDGDRVYEGRLVNSGNGEYKGYPLDTDEWPSGLEAWYADI